VIVWLMILLTLLTLGVGGYRIAASQAEPVALELAAGPRAGEAIEDAVLRAPWIAAQPRLRVAPVAPGRWRVEVCLVEKRMAPAFERWLRLRFEDPPA
jgi:hypothetical protein